MDRSRLVVDGPYNVLRTINYVLTTRLHPKVHAPARGLLGRHCRVRIYPGGTISFGNGLVTGNQVEFASFGELILGDNVFINDGCKLVAHERVQLGDNVQLGSYVTVLDHDHAVDRSVEGKPVPLPRTFVTAPISIGSDVWIGDKVTILKGVTIGDNVVVGANAVVSRDVPSGSVVAGVPARPIK